MCPYGDKPLITLAVAAFNQERFIREAVEAAFAQTYSPLEIILSDDCSQDRTFDIMREMAVAYRGPHRVVLNRNPSRRSIGGHLNRVVELAHGELIVGAAGDDISLPHRTQAVFAAWERWGRQATSIHSNFVQINESGQPTEQIFSSSCHREARGELEQKIEPLAYVQSLEPIVFGCTHAFSPRLFRVFGELPANVIHEDNVLALRSILAGRVLYVNEVLVKYRVHTNNVYIQSRERGTDLKTLEHQEDRVRSNFRNRETMYDAFLLDLEKARLKALIEAAEAWTVAQEARRCRDRAWLMGRFLESGLFAKCRILLRLRREGLSQTELRMLTRRLLPRPVLLRLRLARGRVAASRSS
jgi:glycosyltransferase involved in cell wall biosynthesis